MTELTPIDIWSAENNITDPIEQRVGYKDYMIGEYLANDELNEETNQLIRNNIKLSLQEVGASDEVISSRLGVKQVPFEEQLAMVYAYTDPASEDRDILREYDVAKNMMAAGTLTEASQQAYTKRMPILEEQVKAIVDSNFDKAQLAKVADGSIPFAKIKRKNGDYTFVGGDLASKLTPVEAYKQSLRAGTISPDDALAIKQSYDIPDGESVPYFKAKNYSDAIAAALTASKEDKDISKWVGQLAENIGEKDREEDKSVLLETGKKLLRGAGDLLEKDRQAFSDLLGEEREVKSKPTKLTDEQLYGLIIDKIEKTLPDSKFIPDTDKRAAIEYFAGSRAAQNGLLKFRTGEEANKNIHYFGYGSPVIHREALTNKAEFNSMLSASDFDDKQKEQLTKDRDLSIQSMFNDYDEVFKDSYLADDWNKALQDGYSKDKKDGEILDEFLQTADYSGVRNRLDALGSSVVDSVVDVGATIGTIFKSDAAREVLLENHRERSSRRRLANMFGDEFGIAMTLGEMAAPVVFDGVTIALLTAATGVGGAAYVGARLTARGVVLGITRGALAVGAKETAGAAAQRLVTSGLVRGATKEAAMESAESALKAYAKTTANKYTIRSAMFIPAATRSAGNTYATVYSALDNSPEGKDLTKEEKHSRALTAGIVAGAVTGGITLGFSALGRGGLEDFILGGATPRQLKAVLTKIRGREFGEGADFDKLVTTYAKNGLKSMWKNSAPAGVVKNFTDEALEEATDELINGYIQSAATGQDVPILQRLQQSAMAGFYGGVFGGATGIAQRTAGQFARGGDIEAESRNAAWNKVTNDLAAKLKDAGSPLAAEVILNRLKNPLQKAATTTAAAKPAATTAATAEGATFDAEIKDIDLPPEVPIRNLNAPEADVEPTTTTESTPTTPTEPPSAANKFTAPAFSFGENSAPALQIPFESTYARTDNGPLETQAGESGILNYGGRLITMFDIGGMKIPFYLSTGSGGKKDVPAGKWYPFFGIGEDGWINKTSSADINDYYGSPTLRAFATHLNDTVGDIRANKDIPKTGRKGPAMSFINQSLNPVQNNTATTATDLNAEIARVKEFLATFEGQAAPSIEPDDEVESMEEIQADLENTSDADIQEAIDEVLSESSPEAPALVFTYTAPEVDQSIIEDSTDEELKELEITPSDIEALHAAGEQQGLTKEQIDEALVAFVPQKPELPDWAMERTRGIYEARTKAAKDAAIAEAAEAAKAAATATKAAAAAARATKAAEIKAEAAAKAAQLADSKAKKAAEKTAAAEAKAAEKAAAAEAVAAEKAAAAEAKAATKKAASERKTGKEAAAADPLQANQIKAIKKAIGSNIETIASRGFPIRLTKGSAYGMPNGYQNVKNPSEISDIISKRIYEKFPVLSVVEVAKYSGILRPEAFKTPQANEFDPVSGKFVERNKQTYYIATDGGVKIGLFDNNPRSMIELLRKKIPVMVPESFPMSKFNKAIEFDKLTREVIDVVGPTAADPMVLESKVSRNNRKTTPLVSKTADDSFELLEALKPTFDAPIEINRDLINIKDTEPLDNPQTTFAAASANVDRLISSIYSSLTGGSIAGDYDVNDKTTAKQAKDTAAAMSVMMGIKRAKLTGALLARTKEEAAMELVPEFNKALVFGEIFQSLQKLGAIELIDKRYSIKAGAEQDARNVLLERIKVPADFTDAKTDLPIAEETNRKAAFIYTFGFKKGQSKPILKEGEKNKTKKLTSDWESKVLDSYIGGIINDAIARPDKDGLFPNIKAIAKRIGTRARERAKYSIDVKISEDVLSLDPTLVSSFLSDDKGSIETIDVNEFGDLYNSNASTIPYIFTIDAAVKAATEVNRSFLKPAFKLINENKDVQQALRRLAKGTVHKDSPSLAEALKPQELFKAVAEWAVSKSRSQMGSYRFRRQFLDAFNATNVWTSTISDAFEAVGAYNYEFKKVTDKKQRDTFTRLGFSELETTLITQRSVPTVLATKLGITEAEAKSLHTHLAKTIHRFDAPSFINSKHRKFFRSKNDTEIKRLNLESGNPNSVVAAMKEIMKSSKNMQHRKVAEFLLKNPDLITKTKFSIANIDNNKAGQFFVGNDGVGHVVINMTGFYGSGVESVLLHEYLHAATVDLTTKPESELSDSQRMAKKRINGLLEISRRNYEKQLASGGRKSLLFESGTQNIEEFIATFFTSKDFQKTLKVTRDAEGSRNFFTRILDAIKDLFGVRLRKAFDSAFSDLIDFTTIGNIDSASTSIEARMDYATSVAINEGRKFSPIPKSIRDAARPAADIDVTQFASFEPLIDGELGTPQQQRMIDYLIDQAVRSLIPADVAVSVFNTQQDADDSGAFDGRPNAAIVATIIRNADGTEQSAIFINRANMRNALLSRSSVIEDAEMAKGLLETLINEELTHVAEFNAIPTETLNAMIDETLDQEFDGIIDDYTADPALRASLKEGIRGPDAQENKRQMIGEHLRMYHQRVARGYTTEEDIAFLEGNPSLMKIVLRYLRGVFRRTYARYNLNKNNPELAAVIHLMSNELRYLQAGSYSVDGHNAFDPRTPLAGFEVLRRQFAATSVDITDETTDEEVANRFQSVLDSVDLPVSQYVKGNYKGFSGIVSLFKGELDPRVTRLKKQQIFFENAVEAIAKNYMTKLAKLIDETDGGVEESDLSDAAGSTEMVTVDKETRLKLSQPYLSALKERQKRVAAGTLDPKYVSAEAKTEMRKRMYKDQLEAYRDTLRDDIRRKQSAALDRIRENYPELAVTIAEFRSVIDNTSRKLKDTYSLSESMQLKFDSNMGIYLTRAYRAFNEEGYIDKVLTSSDEKFVEIRDKVTPYFEKRYAEKLAGILKKKSKIDAAKDPAKKELTKEEALQKAYNQIKDDPSLIPNFMAQFLRSYEKDYRKRRPLEGGVTKSLIDNLKEKGNLDWAVRELLGEYKGSDQAINNMFRTYAVVTSMVSRQSFYNNLISIGSMVEQTNVNGKKEMVGFLMTRDELNDKMRNDPAFIASDYVNLRTGRSFIGDAEDTIPKDLAGQYDPTYHYYGPKELIDGMRNAYSPQFDDENKTSSRRFIDNAQWLASTLTGLALGAKTLFSVGFYFRNIVSNMAFFGPSQGFVNVFGMAGELGLVWEAGKNPNNIDETRTELVTLGILNNEMTTGLLKDILSGKVSIGDMENEMKDIADQLKAIKDKSAKPVEFVMSRLQALSGAVDGFYKVAYFKHELDTLERARQADIDAGNDSYYSRLSDYEMKREAARKVLATAQSYSEAPPVVKDFVRGPGVLVSPFLRFKIEVPRIVWNTYKEGVAEWNSGNPVMRARGAKRMAGMTAMLTLVSGGLTEIFKGIFDIGDEEEEVRRRALPSYMQDNSVIYFTWGGKLRSVDLTFVNPYALGVDPIMRGIEKASRGDISGAAMATLSAFWGTYGDMQILYGSIQDTVYNRDSKTGQKIYNETDGLGILRKGIMYVLDKSYNPRVIEKSWDAYKASQAPVVDEQYSASSILLGEFAPVRTFPIDTSEQYAKLTANASSELRANRASLNILRSKRPISDEEIKELAREQIANKIAISQGVFKTTRGLVTSKHGDFGIDEAAGILKEKGYGPRNINLIFNGYIERPAINKELAERVINNLGDEGYRRLKILNDEFEKEPQFIKFDTK